MCSIVYQDSYLVKEVFMRNIIWHPGQHLLGGANFSKQHISADDIFGRSSLKNIPV